MNEPTRGSGRSEPTTPATGDASVPSDATGDDEEEVLPGEPSLENAVFVLLGMLGTLAVYIHIFRLFS